METCFGDDVRKSGELDVMLVSMPFAQLPMPSIALALLKSTLAVRGVRAKVVHFTLDFGERIGVQLYSMIAVGFPGNQALTGDWVFSHLLPGVTPDDEEGYLQQIIDNEDPDSLIGPVDPVSFIEGFREGLVYSRGQAGDFVRECAEKLAASSAPIIGFTCTFQQIAASLAVAYEIRKIAPEKIIVLGGANCEGTMGPQLLKSYDCLDIVVSGEADWTFPELVNRLLHGQSPAGLSGVHMRDGAPAEASTPFVVDMDALPDCDFDDYFEQFNNSALVDSVRPMVLYETARGCWWGEKAHCTFCGLNGQTMEYRRKSPERALEELRHLTTRYPGRSICVVDNILDTSYFKTFVPALAEAQLDADLFWEVKSNLTKDQLVQLRGANVRRIQPGVENFSNQVLKLMKKGVSGIQNIQLLKWCRELSMEPIWNILWGFPGESPEEYRRMADYLPRLHHLTPPITGKQIRMDRFSPNFFAAESLGFTRVRPSPAYKFVFRLDQEAIFNLAYYFAYDYADGRNVRAYVQCLAEAIDDWVENHPGEEMFYVDADGAVQLFDYRRVVTERYRVLTGLERDIFLFCDRAHPEQKVVSEFSDRAAPEEIRRTLRELTDSFVLLEDEGMYLTLAVSTATYRPQKGIESYYTGEAISLSGTA